MPNEGLRFDNSVEFKQVPLIGKNFFELQFQFAKELHNQAIARGEKTELTDVVWHIAPNLKSHIFVFDPETKAFSKKLKDGITEENLVDKAYEDYLFEDRPIVKNLYETLRFGPFEYSFNPDMASREDASLHFVNDSSMRPRELLNVELRKKDMEALLRDIKLKHPHTVTLSTTSWLLDSIPDEVARTLFPVSFIDSKQVCERKTGWSVGYMIWGQFLDARGKLKEGLAEELLKNLKNMKEDEYLIDILRPPLYKPMSAQAPIEDFYAMYGIV